MNTLGLRLDLHMHTTYSDGELTPDRIVERAVQNEVNVLAVTDHDTMLGLPQAAACCLQKRVCFIPGVEISAEGEDEVHILGYGVRGDMPRLSAFLGAMRDDRTERNTKIAGRLRDLGYPLDDAAEYGAASYGRNHIALTMVNKGYVNSRREAFERFLSAGRPAYVPRHKMPVADVIAILLSSGAVPVLAHPGLLRQDKNVTIANAIKWKEYGLRGMEAFHPAHLPDTCAFWEQEARRLGLLVTGGSDFHDGKDQHGELGIMLKHWGKAEEDTQALLEALPA
jgi:3',5'-nucleoside bisphosphate phosphatase